MNILLFKYRAYLLLILIIAVILFIFFQQMKIKDLEKLNLNLQQKLSICKTNEITLLNNIKQRDDVIKYLRNEINTNKNKCDNILKKKDKLINDIQKIQNEKPKDIKPQIIYKEKCQIKIETKESLNENDNIFNVFSNIGK